MWILADRSAAEPVTVDVRQEQALAPILGEDTQGDLSWHGRGLNNAIRLDLPLSYVVAIS